LSWAPPTGVDLYQEDSMLGHSPNDPADDGNAIAGAFLAALLGSGIMAVSVALVMLLN
jgi:hypothetical protein